MVRKAGHKPRSETFTTAKDAKAWIRKVEDDLESRRVNKNPDVLIDALIDIYEKEVAPKRRMAASHLGHDVPSVRRRFGAMRLSALAGNGLIEWVLKRGDVAPSTSAWHISRLCGVLKQLEMHVDLVVPWEDIEAAKAKLVDGGYLSAAKERDRRVSDAELAAIKRNCGRREKLSLELFDFCLLTAMRIGEVCRIRWADLDERNKTILIRDRKHPTKKFGNDQAVPLLFGSFEVLMRQPKRGDRIWPHNPQYVSKVFHKGVVKSGIEDMVLHDLRHEGISRMFEKGFSIPEVSLVSGHRDWKQLRRYAHLKATDLFKREAVLNGQKEAQVVSLG